MRKEPSAGPAGPAPRPRIVVVEDDPLFRRLVREWLLPSFDVLVLEDGRTLKEDAIQFGPDAVVLDMGLPFRSGADLCRDLRSDGRTASVPVLFLTAQASEERFTDFLSCRGDTFLPKSPSPRALRAALRRLLGDASVPDVEPKGT